MKSKRRHELETNALADHLGQWYENAQPYLTTAAFAVLAVVAVTAGWYYWTAKKKTLAAEAWRTYMFAASNPEGNMIETLSRVSDNFSDTKAGLWAALTEADIQANQGVRMLFQDKATAETSLDEAIKTYNEVLSRDLIEKSPMVKRRTHFGLAQALEATGRLDEAIEHYQQVVDAKPDSALAKAAKRRIDDLSQDKTKQWYEWLAAKEPVPKKPKAGPGGPGGALGAPGSRLDTLPTGPDTDFTEQFATEPDAAEPSKSPVPGGDESVLPGKKETDASGAKTTPLQPLELPDMSDESEETDQTDQTKPTKVDEPKKEPGTPEQ
ncbi:MAG: tetratricopeptide repeat protein [Planctomycetota bacterium]